MKSKKKQRAAHLVEVERPKHFLELVAPSVLDVRMDHYLCGNTWRKVLALREYPTSTQEQAILRRLGEKAGVTLHIYNRRVTPVEEGQIIQNAANRNKMKRGSTNDLRQTVEAEQNLQDMASLLAVMQKDREPLIHCAVFLELVSQSEEQLRQLETEVLSELSRSKLGADRLLLRQLKGFQTVQPWGSNCFGRQYERVLPVGSVANLYPFNYSGKTDPHGFYLGKDKFGSNVIVDFDRRSEDKGNANVLILGNSGQGKSYLLKLILTIFLESGKRVLCLDPEHEYRELTEHLDGCFIDLMAGTYIINPLQPKCWNDGEDADEDGPQVFRQTSRLSQHISFLRDWFRTYKDFSTAQIDLIEIMLGKLYDYWGITDRMEFDTLSGEDYPILSDLYALMEREYQDYQGEDRPLFTAELLRDTLLGLHSLCVGAESKFFNGHTNITSARFLTFGVKDLLQTSKNVRDAMLFNVLSYLSDELLRRGNAAAAIDELYLFLSNPTAIDYIRGFEKRVRKKDSALILASQNLEDFDVTGIRELTRPLFAIPIHVFLFNAGNVDARFYMDNLQLEQSEYDLIRYPQRGTCLYKCGNERYLLEVHAPEYKEKLFGTAGGR